MSRCCAAAWTMTVVLIYPKGYWVSGDLMADHERNSLGRQCSPLWHDKDAMKYVMMLLALQQVVCQYP